MLNQVDTKKKAFTFIEVLIAMGILIATVMLTSKEEMRSIFRILRDRDRIEKVFILKKSLYNYYLKKPSRKQKRKQKITLEEPRLKITTELVDIQKKSSLKDFVKKLQIVTATGEWEKDEEKRQAAMVTFVLRAPEQKDKKK